MGFLFGANSIAEKKLARKQAVPVEWLNKMRCSACPRNSDRALKHPKMKPTGSKHPLIYILGEANGETEDLKGRHFIGKSGQLLRHHLAGAGLDEYPIRWNNTIRCRPPQNRTPTPNEIECCRDFQTEDIQKHKPRVVIVFGNIPLHWAIAGISGVGITAWRGRFVPAKIGTHECWVYPMIHPSAVLRSGDGNDKGKEERDKAAQETVFRTDLEALARFIRADPAGRLRPRIIKPSDYRAGITCYGRGTKADAEAVIEFLRRAENDDYPGIDVETKNLRPYRPDSRILTCAVSIHNGQETIAFPVDWRGAWQERKLRDRVWQALVRFMHAKKPRKIAHNHKFEAEWFGYKIAHVVVSRRKWACTQAQAYILDSRQGMLDLDTQVRLSCGFWLKVQSKIDTKKDLETTYKLDDVLMYNGLDAKWCVPVYWHQQSALSERPQHLELARERVETSSTLALAQLQGLPVDMEAHAELLDEFKTRLAEIEERAHELKSFRRFHKIAKRWPDVDGKDDMQLLFTRINPCPKLMVKGKISTAENLLSELGKRRYPEVAVILDLREVRRVLSTYLEPLPGKIAADGCIHTNFNPFQTDTERLSSEDPNVQNWPKRQNKHVRKVIKAGVASS